MNSTQKRLPEESSKRSSYLTAGREQSTHAEHLRQLGQIAAGVSHDLLNLLNGMSLRLQTMERAAPQDPAETAATVAKLREDIGHGVAVLARVTDFGRASSAVRWDLVDLRDLAHEACELSKMRMTLHAVVPIAELHAPAPQVRVRAAEVLSAAVNLIINAIDATSDNGPVRVSTGGDARGSWLAVSDSGPGLPREVKERLFQPFVTTKGAHGCGLGLFQVAECAREHAGRVSVDTRPGRGTTFKLWFPASAAEPVRR